MEEYNFCGNMSDVNVSFRFSVDAQSCHVRKSLSVENNCGINENNFV